MCKTDEYRGISLVPVHSIHGNVQYHPRKVNTGGWRIWWLKSKEGLGKEGDVEPLVLNTMHASNLVM